MRIFVAEKNGIKLSNITNHTDPFTEDYCVRPDCFVCRTAPKPTKGSCWRLGTVYRIDCIECLKRGISGVYHGESGFSPYYRGRFHLDGLRRGAKDNVLYSHNLEHHPEKRMQMSDFRMTVVDQYSRPILRQSHEGLSIAHSIRERDEGARVVLLNSKKEFYQPGIINPSFQPARA